MKNLRKIESRYNKVSIMEYDYILPIGKDKWALAGLAITTVGVLPAIAVVTTVAATIWNSVTFEWYL